MADVKKSALTGWTRSRDALLNDLASAQLFLTTADDEQTVAGTALIGRIGDELARLALVGLQLVDDAIAASDLVKQINDEAQAAKRESERIKQATKVLGEITKAVDLAAGVVTRIVALA